MFEWLSDNRATFALVSIIGLVAAFVWSIHIGLRQTRLRAKDEVFGDPERTRGGWYWAVCGVSALMLVWFYYSWGVARAVFPQAANELCQVAKIKAPLGDRELAAFEDFNFSKVSPAVAAKRDSNT